MITPEELHNLEVVFAYARQGAVADEAQLLNIINFKKDFFDKLKQIIAKSEKEVERIIENLNSNE